MKEVTYTRNTFQQRLQKALDTEKRIIAVYAGWRCGKTDYIGLGHIIIRQALQNPDVTHLIGANTYSQLVDSTLRALYKHLDVLGMQRVPEELPRNGRPFTLMIWNGTKWVEFLCRSMDNWDIISGTTLGSIWLDEVWNTPKWTFDLAMSRLSDKKSKHLQLVMTTTKDEPTHWTYTDIVEKATLPEGRDLIEVVEGSTFDNSANLVDGYIDMQKATLDGLAYDRFILNKWVSLTTGKIFYAFSRAGNVTRVDLDPHLPIRVCCDFNVDPMCWSLWQMQGKGTSAVFRCFDQVMIRQADTLLTIKTLVDRYEDHLKQHGLVIYGDASGKSMSTKSINSDYDIIKQYLQDRQIPYTFNVPASNPSIRDSANAVNGALKNANGDVRLYVDVERCPDMILSLEGTTYKPGTLEKDDKKDRDPNERVKTHFGDTARYIVDFESPARLPRQGRVI